LEEAINYAKRIYEGVHTSSIDSQTAFKLMGFAGKSGASATALGSVRQFGLIEGMGENTRVTDLALRIFEPGSSAEHAQATREASRLPDAFAAIEDRFGGKTPTVDEPIRAFLIRDLGFSSRGADECITSFRRTNQFVSQFSPQRFEVIPVSEVFDESASSLKEPSQPSDSGKMADRITPDDSDVIRIPLSKECTAEIRFTGPISEKALSNMIRHIELMKELWD